MTDVVDLLDVRRAVGHARTREQRVDRRSPELGERRVDRRLLTEVDVDGLRARELDVGEIHDGDVGTGILHELGDGRAHPARSTDDERALAVVAKGAEQ